MDLIDLIIYITIVISGTVFGSFFTLAVHRIPKKQDITHERSYCPKCNHKLGFWDLIPVFSYIFLGGKCRYCKEKIRPRYLILELLSGLLFLLIALKCNINYFSTIPEILYFCLIILFLVCLIIVAGIDKELYRLFDSVILYGAIIAVIKTLVFTYFDYQVISNIISFFICSIVWLFLGLIDNLIKVDESISQNSEFKSQRNNFNYFLNIIKYLGVIGLFFDTQLFLMGLVIFVAINFVHDVLNKIVKKSSLIPQGMLISLIYVVLFLLV